MRLVGIAHYPQYVLQRHEPAGRQLHVEQSSADNLPVARSPTSVCADHRSARRQAPGRRLAPLPLLRCRSQPLCIDSLLTVGGRPPNLRRWSVPSVHYRRMA
jgi:hypothetical protein